MDSWLVLRLFFIFCLPTCSAIGSWRLLRIPSLISVMQKHALHLVTLKGGLRGRFRRIARLTGGVCSLLEVFSASRWPSLMTEQENVYKCNVFCLKPGFYSPLQGAHGLKGNEGPHGPPGPAVSTIQCILTSSPPLLSSPLL